MSLAALALVATLVANFPRCIHGLTDVSRQHLHLRMDTAHHQGAYVEVDFDGDALLQTSFGSSSPAAVSGPALSLFGVDVLQQPGDPMPDSPFETGAMFPPDVISPDIMPEHHVYNETLANASNASNVSTTVAPSPGAGNDTNASDANVTVDPYANNATRVVNVSDIVVDAPLVSCEDAFNGSNASIMCTTTSAPNTTTFAPSTTPASPATNTTATAESNTTAESNATADA